MFCPGCGNSVPDGSSFCNVCGTAIAPAMVSSSTSAPSPPPVAAPQTSGKSIASLIFGLFSFLFPAAVVAIVMGHISLSEINKSAGRITGRGMAIAGLVLGYLGVSFIPFLIIAAIAIPNLLRARIAANEASAVASIRSLNASEIGFARAHPETGFTCRLDDLVGSGGEYGWMDPSLAGGKKHGYVFALQNCASDTTGGPNSKYQISGYPEQHNQTGGRAFCSDESAVIRFDANGSAENCLENGGALQ